MEQQIARDIRDDLQERIFPWTLMPFFLFGLLMALLNVERALPPGRPFFGLLTLVVAGALVGLYRLRARLGIVVTYLAGLGLVALAESWFPGEDAYWAALYLVVAAGVVSGYKACLAVTGISLCALWAKVLWGHTTMGISLSPLAATTVFASVAFALCVTDRSRIAFLAWAWENYDRARLGLARAQNQQVELKQALQDLDLANHEVVRLNDLLGAAREAIEEARRAKEAFVANVSHELRTPLNMVIGYSDEILERPDLYSQALPKELMTDIAAIKRNAVHLAHLVDDVLDLSEADAGYTQLAKQWHSLPEMIAEVEGSMRGLFEKKGLRLTVDAPGDLLALFCDRLRIRQVILNLVSNAARFTERGGATIRVRHEGGMVTIEVADTGEGIGSRALERLFEPFQQGDASTRRRYGGTGLGLAISKRFVEMHGGRIWITSEVGQGTIVSFSLAVGGEEKEGRAARWFSPYHEYEPRSRSSLVAHTQPKPRVLVIEQEPGLAPLMERFPDSLDVMVAPGLDGLGAALETEPISALVVNEQGPELVATPMNTLPATAFDIPIFRCQVPSRRASTDDLGAEAYLIKPIRRPQLMAAIAAIRPKGQRILIADDDMEARHLYSRMLADSEEGYTVRTVSDGQSALAAMTEWQPSLVLLDLIMPNQDGFAVLARKAQDPAIRSIPVIVVSAKDPQHIAPTSQILVTTRQSGLSPSDLARAIEATIAALPPRYAAPAQPETPAP